MYVVGSPAAHQPSGELQGAKPPTDDRQKCAQERSQELCPYASTSDRLISLGFPPQQRIGPTWSSTRTSPFKRSGATSSASNRHLLRISTSHIFEFNKYIAYVLSDTVFPAEFSACLTQCVRLKGRQEACASHDPKCPRSFIDTRFRPAVSRR